MKSDTKQPSWPKKKRSECVSEVAYIAWKQCSELHISAFNDWLKEQKPVVMPEKVENISNSPLHDYEDGEVVGYNACIDEFLRLNPQIRRSK